MNTRFLALAIAALCAAIVTAAAADGRQESPTVTTVAQSRMLPFAAMLNELSQRRRRVVYTTNASSWYDGANVDLVQVGGGNLSLRRADLVTRDLMPIEAARVCDSRRTGPGDFGRGGWALSLAERLDVDGEYARLVLADGRLLALRPDGDGWRPRRWEPAAPVRVAPAGPGLWRVADGAGGEALYAAHADGGSYEIAQRRDRFGNVLRYEYDRQDRLARVTSARRSIALTRDGAGRITSVTDDSGRQVRYEYDASGFLARTFDPAGHPWHYQYDEAGRLLRAVAPAGTVDLAVRYDDRGRVLQTTRQGRATRFDYDVTLDGAADLRGTRVTTPGRADRLFGQADDGVTVFAQNAGGAATRMSRSSGGPPSALTRDGSSQWTFDYDDERRLTRLAGRGWEWRFDYDAAGLHRVTDAQGSALVSVERDPDGTTRVRRGVGVFAHTLRGDGAVIGVEYPGAERYTLTSDAHGRITGLVDTLGQALRLDYDAAGRLSGTVFPGGERHDYRYDDLGLRTGASRGPDVDVRYDYTPAGRIYRYEVNQAGGERAVTAHRFDEARRLVAVEGKRDTARIEYGPADRVRSVDMAGVTLVFEYDALGRFVAVTLGDEAWRYDYAAAEPDLVLAAASRRHFPAAGGAGEDVAAGLYERLYLRRPPNMYGPLQLDGEAGRFILNGEFGVALPGDDVRYALQAIGLIGVDGRALASAATVDAHGAFESPSNLLFVPPEYWALNCIVCFGVQPHGLISARAASPSLALAAVRLEQVCDVDIDVQPDCELEVSGLPAYLCDATQAQIGALLTPVGLPGQFIDWSTNDYLNPVPVGASGPHVFVRATSPGGDAPSGQGTVTASYSRQGAACSDTGAVAVIANDPVNFAQVTDLAACPERQQDTTRLHDVDGCSIDTVLADFVFSANAQDPIGGQFHAPGHPTTFGAVEGALPYGTTPVDLPCNNHDVCYQTCGSSREGCDGMMFSDMLEVCDASYPSTCPFTFLSPACASFETEKVRCALGSAALHTVLRAGGQPSYAQRQVQHCDCCPP